MSTPRKTRTMYMHTLDKKPARAAWYRGGDFLLPCTPRTVARLETSLKNLRRTQKHCIEHAESLGDHEEWAVASRYGYILVEVPM